MKKQQPVETKFFTFAKTPEDAFLLESGETFGPITLAYETYGELSPERDNAILVFHAFSGSQHAAGYNPCVPDAEKYWTEEYHQGWWDAFIGPGKALDTRQYFVICINYFGGCYGSTGPCSLNPQTGKPYGRQFPIITVSDVVDTQVRLLDHMGIKTLLAVIGGSLGGILAIDLAMRHPERTRCVIPIAAGPYCTTLQKLANFEQIFAIETDPNFNYGDYYDGPPPHIGLILARMIAHKYYVHLHVMEDRASKQIIQDDGVLRGYRLRHQIESYMLYQGKKFVKRFDANTYLRILNIWQQFDLARKTDGNLVDALRPCKHQRFLVFSVDSDVCFWPEEQAELCETLKELDINYLYITLHSDKGHDSFLLEPELYTPNIEFLLKEAYKTIKAVPA